MKTDSKCIVVDAREFVNGRFTGIGRVLEGLVDALVCSDFINEVVLALPTPEALPSKLENRSKVRIKKIPISFFRSEKALSDATKDTLDLFISPYPKLPLFGVYCPSINIIHDVQDLTFAVYKRRIKCSFDKFRLKRAIKKACMTWYVSSWSLKETEKLIGFCGRNPKIRRSGINEIFNTSRDKKEDYILMKYDLRPKYILILGNGMPHKNLGILLKIANNLSRRLVFVGVSMENQRYWKSSHPKVNVKWIPHASEKDLPAIIRNAFCLAQPSSVEGYGYPPLEAMACGVPVVISNIPVLTETTGGKAVVAQQSNSSSWIDSFQSLEDEANYRRHVKSGLRWVKPLTGIQAWRDHLSDIHHLLCEQQSNAQNTNN